MFLFLLRSSFLVVRGPKLQLGTVAIEVVSFDDVLLELGLFNLFFGGRQGLDHFALSMNTVR